MTGDEVHLKVVEDGQAFEVRNGTDFPVDSATVSYIKSKKSPDSGLRMPTEKRVQQLNSHLPDPPGDQNND